MIWNKKKKYKSDESDQVTSYQIEIINQLIEDVGSSIDLDKVLQKSADSIVDALSLHGCILFLLNPQENSIYTKTISQSRQSRTALRILRVNNFLDQLKVSLRETQNLVVDTIVSDKLNQSEELWRYTVGVLDKPTVNLIQTATLTGTSISIPIKFKSKIIGALLFTKRSRGTSFTSELPILKIYASEVGIAISNANLFKEKNEQLRIIENKNKELYSLYNLTSQISKSLDPDVVSQTAVDSLPQDQTMIGAILTEYVQADGSIIVKALTQNRVSDAARNLLGDFQKYKTLVNDPSAVGTPTVKAILSGEPQFTDDLVSAFSPPIPKTLVMPLLRIINVKSLAVYPVISRGRVVGTIGYLMKDKSYTELEENQKQLLQTYTTQISIALENARLFTEVERVKNKLEIALSELQIARERERDMIDIMGHELRTPMSIVRNALGMMELHLKKEGSIPLDKQQKYVDAAIESAKREINLIETLLSATKADSKGFQLTLEKVDLLDVINDSLEALKSQAIKRGLEIKYQKPDKDLFVYCDRTRIQEVADNFIGNAIKYTPKGFVEISVEVKGSFGWVHVKDSGVGIDEQDLKKLGRKFFRAKQYTGDPGDPASIVRPGGTGLGLYVSFNLVRIMEGILDVQSKVGEGSIFSFAMPLFTDQKTTQVERKVAPEQTSIESLR